MNLQLHQSASEERLSPADSDASCADVDQLALRAVVVQSDVVLSSPVAE